MVTLLFKVFNFILTENEVSTVEYHIVLRKILQDMFENNMNSKSHVITRDQFTCDFLDMFIILPEFFIYHVFLIVKFTWRMFKGNSTIPFFCF